MNKNIIEISKIAATWWANVIINPKFDNGDDSKIGDAINRDREMRVKEVTDETKVKFLNHLSKAIESKLTLKAQAINISVDYSPDKILVDSAEYANLSTSNFPIKTTMWISINHVAVSYGYTAKTKYLYVNKKFWYKEIDCLNESIKEYGRGIAYYDWLTESDIAAHVTILKKKIKEYQINLEKSAE
ncbi:hypothetical protein [Clostridium sp.]|uniref:hypothetical protein n=1 Tax=Clostridium sp. TaxID=1506 RepID=UPI002608482A|nr:hypothetical protein [uncultured Clostridium sp.]